MFRFADGKPFMLMKEGRLIFEGDQDEFEASNDPYISKFYKRRV